MKTHKKPHFRPQFESVEERRLMSVAVLEILNESKYTVGFDFRWTPSSAWTAYTEAPGQGQVLYTTTSSSLNPQALFNPTTVAGNETTVTLGFNQWNGTGTPPASAAALYEFQNTTSGVGLYYVPPPSTQTDAVVSIGNSSGYTVTFDFRWTPSSPWTAYTESPGQSEVLWTAYSTGLAPQVLYNPTTTPGVQSTVTLAQGYGEWTGTGNPPASAGVPYGFENTSTGPELFYTGGTLGPAPNTSAITGPNWSGYVAEANFAHVENNSVTFVSGTWNVPTVSGPSTGTVNSAIWVGIDGYANGNGTVEQLGTQQEVVNGVNHYIPWWEMYSPGAKQPEQPISTMTIGPGDSISASVQYFTSGPHAGYFLLSMVDNSRINDYFNLYVASSQVQSPLAQRNCAEWIVEAPTEQGGSLAALPQFSPVTFTNASAVINGVLGPINSGNWQSQALNIGSGPILQDITSVLVNSGTGFVVSYNPSTATIPLAVNAAQAKAPSNASFAATTTESAKRTDLTANHLGRIGASHVRCFRMPVRQLRPIADGALKEGRLVAANI